MSKTWFITGCSTGFGHVLAETVLKTGDNVVATARKREALQPLEALAEGNLLSLVLDVTEEPSISRAVKEAESRFGGIDVLVNNAGYGLVGALEETSEDALRRLFETNMFGLVRVTLAALPGMRARGKGYIINMSSIAGLAPTAGFSAYNGTKYAVEGLSEALALEVAPHGIKVTLIEPGPFRTDFASRSLATMAPTEPYAQSVGKTRQYLEKINGRQPGDPIRAAKILIQLAGMSRPPMHMPLGNIAVDRVKTKLQDWQKILNEHETIMRSADYTKEEMH